MLNIDCFFLTHCNMIEGFWVLHKFTNVSCQLKHYVSFELQIYLYTLVLVK